MSRISMYVRLHCISRQFFKKLLHWKNSIVEKWVFLDRFHQRRKRDIESYRKYTYIYIIYIHYTYILYIYIYLFDFVLSIIFLIKKVTNTSKNLASPYLKLLDTEKKRSRENPEIVIRFDVFFTVNSPILSLSYPLLRFRFVL